MSLLNLRAASLVVSLAALLALAGCSSSSDSSASSAPADSAQEAGVDESGGAGQEPVAAVGDAETTRVAALALALKANPENSEALLKDAGMTEEQLVELLYEIAADPKRSAAYTEMLNQ